MGGRLPDEYLPGELISSWGSERFADREIARLRRLGIAAHKTVEPRTREAVELLGEFGFQAPSTWGVRAGRRAIHEGVSR